MPYLDIVGVTSFNTTFFSCGAFLTAEREADYIWAMQQFATLFEGLSLPSTLVTDRELALMNAIHTVFPHSVNLLCVWHIQKNVMARCRKEFANQELWQEFQGHLSRLFKSQSAGTFEAAWNEFRAKFGLDSQPVQYIQSRWMPYKTHFISAWADEYLHLGETNTSRVEGSHSLLKRYLQTSTGDLKTMVERCSMAIEEQRSAHDRAIGFETANLPHTFSHAIFSQVVCKVSRYCLKIVNREFKFAIQARQGVQRPPCTGKLQRTMALPCEHQLLDFLTACEPIPMSSIGKHWWITDCGIHDTLGPVNEPIDEVLDAFGEKYANWPASRQAAARALLHDTMHGPGPSFREPLVQRTRGRPVGATAQNEPANSTRRDPSAFEHVAAQVGDNRSRNRCSRCAQPGHNSRRCPRAGINVPDADREDA